MRVEKTLENVQSCMCLACPSYTNGCKAKNEANVVRDMSQLKDVKHLEMLFCAFEKSNCIHEHQGCMCAKCPVHHKYALNNEDYCLNTGGIL